MPWLDVLASCWVCVAGLGFPSALFFEIRMDGFGFVWVCGGSFVGASGIQPCLNAFVCFWLCGGWLFLAVLCKVCLARPVAYVMGVLWNKRINSWRV